MEVSDIISLALTIILLLILSLMNIYYVSLIRQQRVIEAKIELNTQSSDPSQAEGVSDGEQEDIEDLQEEEERTFARRYF